LLDSVIVGVKDFYIHREPTGSGLGRSGLLDLIVVIVVGQGYYES